MNYEFIKYTIKDSVVTIELNDPPVNTLSNALVNDLINGLKNAEKDIETKVIVLKAQDGAKIFSAGHNIKELPLKNIEPLSYDEGLRVLVRTVKTVKKPIISMIEGGVYGGAFETVMSTDIVVASENVTFAMTPVNIGMAYNLQGVESLLGHIGLHLIKEMLFTGSPISAAKAAEIGLINYSVPVDELSKKTYEIAKTISKKAQKSVQLLKEEIRILTNNANLDNFERINSLRKNIYEGHDYNEGLVAFLEKRKPNFIE
jgi:methylmalonyl-CoA decarboxylase